MRTILLALALAAPVAAFTTPSAFRSVGSYFNFYRIPCYSFTSSQFTIGLYPHTTSSKVVRRGMKLNSAVAEEIMAHGGPLVNIIRS